MLGPAILELTAAVGMPDFPFLPASVIRESHRGSGCASSHNPRLPVPGRIRKDSCYKPDFALTGLSPKSQGGGRSGTQCFVCTFYQVEAAIFRLLGLEEQPEGMGTPHALS